MFDYYKFIVQVLKSRFYFILFYSILLSAVVAVLCFLAPLNYIVRFTIIPEDNYQKSILYLKSDEFLENVFVSFYKHPVESDKQYYEFKKKIEIIGEQKSNFIDVQVESSTKKEAEVLSSLIFSEFKKDFISKGLTAEAAEIFTFKLRQKEVDSRLAFYKAELSKPELSIYIKNITTLDYEKIKMLASLQADLAVSSIGLTNLDYMESSKSLLDIYRNLDVSIVKSDIPIINNMIYYYYWDYINSKLSESVGRLEKQENNKIKVVGNFKTLYRKSNNAIVIGVAFFTSSILMFFLYLGFAEFERAQKKCLQ
jgi:hypothetical protein